MKIEYVIFDTWNTPYIATVEAAQSYTSIIKLRSESVNTSTGNTLNLLFFLQKAMKRLN